MDENAVGKIKTKIEQNISQIRKIEMTLNSDDQEGLFDSLKSLHYFVYHFAEWVSSQVTTQFEDTTKNKVKEIIDAGFSFESIVLNGVKFQIDNEGNIEKCPDDDIPF
jgi:hypothetical protein